MGALHDGHLALVKLAEEEGRPRGGVDFRQPDAVCPDRRPCAATRVTKPATSPSWNRAGADLVWAPAVEEMYPDGFSTSVTPGSAAEDLEGAIRPHHFGGVATVCCKLFSQVTPDIAIFGEKDFQQLSVLKQMVRDLNLPLTIIGAKTQRAKDGLALSSRNAYLTADERKIAPALHAAISELARGCGQWCGHCLRHRRRQAQVLAAGFAAVDYIDVRDAGTLAKVERAARPAAARSGSRPARQDAAD